MKISEILCTKRMEAAHKQDHTELPICFTL